MNASKRGGLIGVAALGLLMMAAPVGAQFRGEGLRRTEVAGVVKTVDGAARTITLGGGEGRGGAVPEKTFTLVKDVEVAVATGAGRLNLFKEAKLADVTPGMRVGLTLSPDGNTVESIVTQGPEARGRLVAVDADKKTVTLAGFGGGREPGGDEKTFRLADDVEIAIDDGKGRRFSMREGTVGDLTPGVPATAWLSPDQKQVQALMAEAPSAFGTLKAVEPTTRTVTLLTRPARGDEAGEEMTLVVPKEALIVVDDGRGRRLSAKQAKLEDVPAGAMVMARLSMDRSSVVNLRAEGPMLGGLLKAVDADKGTVTIAFPRGRGEEPDEKTLTVAKEALINIDGASSTLGNLKIGDNGTFLQLRLSLDQKTVYQLTARQGGSR